MKKIYFILAISSMFLATSCCHTLYNTRTLQGNYDVRMDTPEELDIKSKVRIFLSENDIEGEYDIISVNLYKPFKIPILMSFKGQITKKFYEKAVKKAYEQGGNGIIINAGGYYKVICLHNWDSDNATSAKYVNAILDTSIMDIFTSGKITKMSQREVKRYVTDFANEIKFNLKTTKTSEEVIVLGKKIEALTNWNNSQFNSDKKLTKRLDVYRTLQKTMQKKIFKKEAKNVAK